jgi:hypothetical protein
LPNNVTLGYVVVDDCLQESATAAQAMAFVPQTSCPGSILFSHSISVTVCLSVCLSVCVRLSVCLPACLSVRLSASMTVYLCAYMPLPVSVCLSVCMSVYLYFRLTVWLLFICVSISVSPSVLSVFVLAPGRNLENNIEKLRLGTIATLSVYLQAYCSPYRRSTKSS